MYLSRRICGTKGEDLVAKTLERDGFTILERNYRQREGEIDIVACSGNLIIFVEVKTRTKPIFDMTEVVNSTKQRRIRAAARRYIFQHRLDDKTYRFDVACIDNLESKTISYIPNAFNESESF